MATNEAAFDFSRAQSRQLDLKNAAEQANRRAARKAKR